jgi:hypothetical protein
VLGLLAMVVNRHVTRPAGAWTIALYCSFVLSGVIADAIALERGKQLSIYANPFYFAQYALWVFGLGTINAFYGSSPVISILWCAAIVACGAASGFVPTKDRVAIVVFDARDPLRLSFNALGVVICAVCLVAAWWSRSWIDGVGSAAGVALVVGLPLCVISWLRQRARTAASSGAGIQV